MKYRYRGMTRNRETVSGEIEGTNVDEVKSRLISMQIRPLNVERSDGLLNLKLNLNFSAGSIIDLKGLIIFTRQLSSLVNSGVTIVLALQILSEQEKRPEFKKVLQSIKEDIEAGLGFAEALQKHPRAFSEFFIRVVEAGEISGSLDKSLVRIGQQLDKLNNIRRKVIGAMMYPTITFVIACGVVSFLLTKVVPEIVSMYGGRQLPGITLLVVSISNWLRLNFMTLLALAIAAFFGMRSAYKIPSVRAKVDPQILKAPVFGMLVLRSGIAVFTRTLSTLVTCGVSLITAFEICEKVTSNFALKECIRDAKAAVTEGQTISQGLAKRGIFPPMVLHMVNIGEMTGKLDDLLMKLSDIYDEEVDDAVNIMTTLLNPILLVGVGGIIMAILLAIYLPLFGMSDQV